MNDSRDFFRIMRLTGMFTMDNHRHNSIELNYVQQGSAVYYVENQPIQLKKGSAVILNADYFHRLEINDKTSKVISLEIDMPFFSNGGIGPLLENGIGYEIIKDDGLIGAVMQDIQNSYYCKEFGAYTQSGIIFLIELARKQRHNNFCISAKLYIADNYATIHCLNDIAKYLNISASHLQRIFKKQAGISIGEYITGIRMINAAYLLQNTCIAVGEIDSKVGMNSRQAFYSSFKKKYGMSPLQYRKKTYR